MILQTSPKKAFLGGEANNLKYKDLGYVLDRWGTSSEENFHLKDQTSKSFLEKSPVELVWKNKGQLQGETFDGLDKTERIRMITLTKRLGHFVWCP